VRRNRIARIAPLLLVAALAAGTAGLAGCARTVAGAETSEPGPAMLIVDNASSIDMDVFMVGNIERIRLGLAPGGRTTRFAISESAAAGAGLARFEAVPISQRGRAVRTDEASVRPGSSITLRVPPQ
jgi:hypothetical protein